MMSDITQGVTTASVQAERAYKHVIQNLIGQELSGRISLSLLEYTGNVMDIREVVSMTDDEIDQLYYVSTTFVESPPPKGSKDGESKPNVVREAIDLPRGSKRLLKILTSFVHYMKEEKEEPIFYDWSNITFEMFNTYRTSIYNGNVTVPAPSRLKPTDESISSYTRPTYKSTQVEQFKKSIRREKSDFMVLKYRKQYRTWISKLRATAATQDVEKVLDPGYKPSTDE